MSTRIEFYERLREHIPEPAARIIAEEMSTERDVSAKLDQLKDQVATKDDVHRVELAVEKLRSSTFRWNLMFFVPLWVGTYASLVTMVLRGSP